MAQYFKGPVAQSLGGASVAGPETHDCLLANPALISHSDELDVGVFYEDEDLNKNSGSSLWGVQLLDNTQNLVAAGAIGYYERTVDVADGSFYKDKVLAAGMSRSIFPLWSAGLSAIQSRHQIEDQEFIQYDASLGFLHTPRPWFGFGYLLQNFTNPSSQLPEYLRFPLQHVVGVMYIWESFLRLRLDFRYQPKDNPNHKWITHSGFETTMGEFFVLRLGAEWDDLNGQSVGTAGIGFKGPRLRINYAFRQLSGEGVSHSVDMRLPL